MTFDKNELVNALKLYWEQVITLPNSFGAIPEKLVDISDEDAVETANALVNIILSEQALDRASYFDYRRILPNPILDHSV